MATAGRAGEGSDSDLELFNEEDFLAMLSETVVQPYMFEPEYTEEELERRDRQEREASTVVAAAVPEGPPRANNTDWCECGRCLPMPTEKESICCKRWPRALFVFEDLPADSQTTKMCVTEHPSFSAHLDSGVLTTFFRIPKIN